MMLSCWDCDYFTTNGLGRCPRHASEDEKRAAQRVIDARLADLLEVADRISAVRTR